MLTPLGLKITEPLKESGFWYNKNMNIEVMGTGCPKCKTLFERTQEAVKTLSLNATVNYITDVEKIVAMGFIHSPILIVDGKAVVVGQLPSTEEITQLIKQSI